MSATAGLILLITLCIICIGFIICVPYLHDGDDT